MSRLLPLLVLGVLALALPTAARAQSEVFQNCSTTEGALAGSIVFSEVPGTGSDPSVVTVIYRAAGGLPVVIRCDDTRVSAMEIEVGPSTVTARGDVLFEQPDSRIVATSAEFDRATRLGVFHDAHGFVRVTERSGERQVFGTAEPDFEFFARRLEKIADRTFRMTDGWFTACAQPTPRWKMTTSSATIVLDRRVLLKNMVLRVKNVPLFYLPALYYPINSDDRSTGLLIPTYGSSSFNGSSLSNAFFIVLGRSHDATLYHDWTTSGGQGFGSEYRYASAPGSQGNVEFYARDQPERLGTDGETVVAPASRSYNLRANVNQQLPRGFHLRGNVNYFTDIQTQRRLQQDLFQLSQRQRDVNLMLTGSINRLRVSADVRQRDAFYGEDRAERFGNLPRVTVTAADSPIGRSSVYVGARGEAAYLVSKLDLDDPTTDRSLWRFDASPRVRVPLSKLSFLTATTTASWRVTHWLERQDLELGETVGQPITRHLFEIKTDVVGPVLARVFDTAASGYAERFKHLIEPFVSFRYLSPFDRSDEIVQNDGVDTLVGGTAQVTYGLNNRILAKRTGSGAVQEILSVGLRQSYYTDLRAVELDPYQSSTPGRSPFTPIRLTVSVRPTTYLSGRFETNIDPEFKVPRDYNASGTYRRERVDISAGWQKRQVIDGLPGYEDPSRASHFLRSSTTVRTADNRTGGTYTFNYDVLNTTLIEQSITAYYNAQCCGLTLSYQTISFAGFGLNIPADRRFGIGFSLAGIGTFSNPMGSFGR